MPKPPAISVLMPVSDAAATLEAAIRSVQAQTWADWELVIVDDGSQDATPTLLAHLASQDERLVILRQPLSGIAQALQHGIEGCRGDFIARMDADDVMAPQRLELQQAFLQAEPSMGLVSCLVRFGGDGAGYAAHVDWINALRTPESMALRRFVEAPVAHPSVMFRRRLIAEHGGYREGDFPEDYELWLRWLEAGVRFGKVEQELLTWNDPPQRLSRTDPRYSVESFYAMKLAYLRHWLVAQAGNREIWLWGAGRITRRRFDPIADLLSGFIDVDEAKRGQRRDGREVRLVDELPPRDQSLILGGVANRGAREAIARHLVELGRMEGVDFLLVA